MYLMFRQLEGKNGAGDYMIQKFELSSKYIYVPPTPFFKSFLFEI